ncbi:hypothetical protein Q7M_1164 (plasmid) [Borrelia crocidurae str. Achema]|uniref:Uncharacterized protein n=1 Tax=Borrelia crocidurae (strain Achema) TaxID=1155096 RepID=I0FFA6_BORCA|nr:hypothetical protein Q7M_1164 [Borrelia crocidurae str. Achema]
MNLDYYLGMREETSLDISLVCLLFLIIFIFYLYYYHYYYNI